MSILRENEVSRDDAGGALPATAAPVLRYSNPVRNFFSDGVSFFWLNQGRPMAAGTIAIRGEGIGAPH